MSAPEGDRFARDHGNDDLVDWATVPLDLLQCRCCKRWEPTVYQQSMLCDPCAEAAEYREMVGRR